MTKRCRWCWIPYSSVADPDAGISGFQVQPITRLSVYRIAEKFGPPSLLDELRRRVQEGRLEVTASTWVEAG